MTFYSYCYLRHLKHPVISAPPLECLYRIHKTLVPPHKPGVVALAVIPALESGSSNDGEVLGKKGFWVSFKEKLGGR